jgi:hypothetical protein
LPLTNIAVKGRGTLPTGLPRGGLLGSSVVGVPGSLADRRMRGDL